jgi:chromosome partitioning protein
LLIVDLDPQVRPPVWASSPQPQPMLIGEAPLHDAVVPTAVPRLYRGLNDGSVRLNSTRINARPRFQLRCDRGAEHQRRRTDYTYVLIDCPP